LHGRIIELWCESKVPHSAHLVCLGALTFKISSVLQLQLGGNQRFARDVGADAGCGEEIGERHTVPLHDFGDFDGVWERLCTGTIEHSGRLFWANARLCGELQGVGFGGEALCDDGVFRVCIYANFLSNRAKTT